MKTHCYCHLLDPRIGTLVDPETADHMRDGIPLCDTRCAVKYDRAQERRNHFDVVGNQTRRLGGQYHLAEGMRK